MTPLVIEKGTRLVDDNRRRRLANVQRVGNMLVSDGRVVRVESGFEDGAPAGNVGGFFYQVSIMSCRISC